MRWIPSNGNNGAPWSRWATHSADIRNDANPALNPEVVVDDEAGDNVRYEIPAVS